MIISHDSASQLACIWAASNVRLKLLLLYSYGSGRCMCLEDWYLVSGHKAVTFMYAYYQWPCAAAHGVETLTLCPSMLALLAA